jgi:hypothetical protein
MARKRKYPYFEIRYGDAEGQEAVVEKKFPNLVEAKNYRNKYFSGGSLIFKVLSKRKSEICLD